MATSVDKSKQHCFILIVQDANTVELPNSIITLIQSCIWSLNTFIQVGANMDQRLLIVAWIVLVNVLATYFSGGIPFARIGNVFASLLVLVEQSATVALSQYGHVLGAQPVLTAAIFTWELVILVGTRELFGCGVTSSHRVEHANFVLCIEREHGHALAHIGNVVQTKIKLATITWIGNASPMHGAMEIRYSTRSEPVANALQQIVLLLING